MRRAGTTGELDQLWSGVVLCWLAALLCVVVARQTIKAQHTRVIAFQYDVQTDVRTWLSCRCITLSAAGRGAHAAAVVGACGYEQEQDAGSSGRVHQIRVDSHLIAPAPGQMQRIRHKFSIRRATAGLPRGQLDESNRFIIAYLLLICAPARR